jgi:cytochrome c oxidase subunit II
MQSALSPDGPEAQAIAALTWVLFAGGGTILVVVCVALLAAMWGRGRLRSILASTGAIWAGGILAPAVLLSVLLGVGIWLTAAAARQPSPQALRIEVVGEQWWWRTRYLADGGAVVAGANEIRIPVGREVAFSLGSADVIHAFWIPSLGGKVDMIPGRTTRLVVSADRPGVYRGQCAEYCGGAHALMAIRVVAMPAGDFAVWLRHEAENATAPTNAEARAGAALFAAAGCGGCHAVRGTAATGTIGPDLTHIGARQTVGLETLPMTRANIAAFIAAPDHFKPQVEMPAFRVLTERELALVAAYLEGLK